MVECSANFNYISWAKIIVLEQQIAFFFCARQKSQEPMQVILPKFMSIKIK
jgi:hypothetical protein